MRVFLLSSCGLISFVCQMILLIAGLSGRMDNIYLDSFLLGLHIASIIICMIIVFAPIIRKKIMIHIANSGCILGIFSQFAFFFIYFLNHIDIGNTILLFIPIITYVSSIYFSKIQRMEMTSYYGDQKTLWSFFEYIVLKLKKMLLYLHCLSNYHQHMPRQERTKHTDSELKDFLNTIHGVSNPLMIQSLEKSRRNYILKSTKDYGAGIRQLSRLTGVSYGVIQKLWTKKKWSQNEVIIFWVYCFEA